MLNEFCQASGCDPFPGEPIPVPMVQHEFGQPQISPKHSRERFWLWEMVSHFTVSEAVENSCCQHPRVVVCQQWGERKRLTAHLAKGAGVSPMFFALLSIPGPWGGLTGSYPCPAPAGAGYSTLLVPPFHPRLHPACAFILPTSPYHQTWFYRTGSRKSRP